MAFSTLSDEQLLKEASEGHFSAFEELIERHGQRLLNYYARMCGSPEVARSLFDETWAELYKLRASQAASGGVSCALFAIATRKIARMLSGQNALGVPRGVAPTGDRSSLSWRNDRLSDALLSLPLKERAALLLCFFDSLSYADAGITLNEREENIRSLAGQGLGRLKELLGDGFLSGGLA